MSRKREFRKLCGEIRVENVNGERKIVGYGAVFNQLSEPMRIGNRMVRERVMPGAFDRCLSGGPDIRGLINHDPNLILGRTKAGTMTVSVDDHGARYEITPPNTSYASDLMESLERGDIDQSSFGFYTIDDGYVNEEGSTIRELREIDCFDMSPVTYPAYKGSSSGLRSEELRSMFPDGIPESLESETKVEKEKRENEEGCDCDCASCESDNCAGCTTVGCVDAECASAGCQNQVRSGLTTKAEVRNAIARFNQKPLDKAQKDAEWGKVLAAAKTVGLEISEENAAKLFGASYRDAKATLREIDPDGDGDDDTPLIEALADAYDACNAVGFTVNGALWTFWGGDSEMSNPLLKAFADQAKVLIGRLTAAIAEADKELAEPNDAPELNSRKQRYRDLFVVKK